MIRSLLLRCSRKLRRFCRVSWICPAKNIFGKEPRRFYTYPINASCDTDLDFGGRSVDRLDLMLLMVFIESLIDG